MTTGSSRQWPSHNGGGVAALPPDRRVRTPASLKAAGSFVPKIAAKVYERFGFHTAEILTQWPRVVGDDIAAVTSPARIKWPRGEAVSEAEDRPSRAGATLVLSVPPSRALEVEYRIGEIRDRINRYFGYAAVGPIKLLQAPDWQVLPVPERATSATTRPKRVAVASDGSDPVAAALRALHAEIQSDPAQHKARSKR